MYCRYFYSADNISDVNIKQGNLNKADIKLLPDMPTGPYNRVADNIFAREKLSWHPEFKFIDGLHKTIDWYWKSKSADKIKETFEVTLTERR